MVYCKEFIYLSHAVTTVVGALVRLQVSEGHVRTTVQDCIRGATLITGGASKEVDFVCPEVL